MSRTLSVLIIGAATAAHASDCSVTSIGSTPINDLGTGLYLGQYQGGLYPNGLNTPPAAHDAALVAAANAITPFDTAGQPDPNGAYVLLSIGMSNTTQEFCAQNGRPPCDDWTFMGQAALHPDVNTDGLVIMNGARAGQAAPAWDSATDFEYNRVRDDVLAPQGLTEAQVRAVWVKVANPAPNSPLPNANADAFALQTSIGNIARAVKTRYPNCEIMFMSSRIYAGYADTPLNPEPYAYESAFSVKWAIEAQIDQNNGGPIDPIAGDLSPAVAPLLAWSAYLWADGTTPRSDGLIWECTDLVNDGTHPSQSGETKVGAMLLGFFLTSPYAAPWFSSNIFPVCPPDLTTTGAGSGDPGFGVPDGQVTGADLNFFINAWIAQDLAIADLTTTGAGVGDPGFGTPDGQITTSDLNYYVNLWIAACP